MNVPPHGVRLVHLALGINQLQEGDMVLAADARVVLAERGGDMYDAGTVGHGDVIVRNDHPGVLFIFNAPDDLALEVEQRLIARPHQIAAGECGLVCDFLIAHDGGSISASAMMIVRPSHSKRA